MCMCVCVCVVGRPAPFEQRVKGLPWIIIKVAIYFYRQISFVIHYVDI